MLRVKDSGLGTTGNDGSYQLRGEPGSLLVFSFIGYAPQQLTVGKNGWSKTGAVLKPGPTVVVALHIPVNSGAIIPKKKHRAA